MEKAYNEDLEYQQQQQQQQEGENQHSADNQHWEDQLYELTSMQSTSLTFVALYTMMVAVGLSFYGSTAIVGFTSLRGVYIAPCFSTSSGAVSTLKLGMFGGAIVLFANLLLICAVIFGEVRVSCKVNHDLSGGYLSVAFCSQYSCKNVRWRIGKSIERKNGIVINSSNRIRNRTKLSK
jgi:hypothetical protein